MLCPALVSILPALTSEQRQCSILPMAAPNLLSRTSCVTRSKCTCLTQCTYLENIGFNSTYLGDKVKIGQVDLSKACQTDMLRSIEE